MIPNFAKIAIPLTDHLRLHPASKTILWPDAVQQSLQD